MGIACHTGSQPVCQQKIGGTGRMPAESSQRAAFIHLRQTAQLQPLVYQCRLFLHTEIPFGMGNQRNTACGKDLLELLSDLPW